MSGTIHGWISVHIKRGFFFFFSLFCYFHSDLCMKMPLLLPVLWDLLFVFFFARKGAFI